MSFSKQLSKYFALPIATYKSKLNGVLRIYLWQGRKILNTSKANFSFGGLHIVFQECFSYLKISENPPASLLLLGLGGGSVIEILRNELQLNIPIAAVEYDPVVINIAKEHFGISTYKNLSIIESDAFEYVQKHIQYDMIIVDVFNELDIPKEFISEKFIYDCLHSLDAYGKLLFNTISNDSEKHQADFKKLENIMRMHQGELEKISVLESNTVLVWTKIPA